jgi:hypothetical protein
MGSREYSVAAIQAFLLLISGAASADPSECAAFRSTTAAYWAETSLKAAAEGGEPKTYPQRITVLRKSDGGFEYQGFSASGDLVSRIIYSGDFLPDQIKTFGSNPQTNSQLYKAQPNKNWYASKSNISVEREMKNQAGVTLFTEAFKLSFRGVEKLSVSGCDFETDIIQVDTKQTFPNGDVTDTKAEYRYSAQLKLPLMFSQQVVTQKAGNVSKLSRTQTLTSIALK